MPKRKRTRPKSKSVSLEERKLDFKFMLMVYEEELDQMIHEYRKHISSHESLGW